MIWGRSLPPVHDFSQGSFQETGGLESEPLSVLPAFSVRKRLKGANERLAVISGMCCTFNAMDAVCTAWHALAPFHESSYTSHFCISFVCSHLLVYLCMCVYVYGFLNYVGPGNWTQSLGLALGIFTYWHSSLYSQCTEMWAVWFSWGYPGGQGGFCFTRPLLHVCHCSTVSCFLLTQGLCSAHLGHVPPLLWTLEDVSLVTAKLPGWRPISYVHVLNHYPGNRK